MAVRGRPSAKLIYTDGRTIDQVGNVLNVFNKPDWSPTTLLSYNYVNHLMVMRRDLLAHLGGLRQAYAGAQDWDLLLRLREELRDEDVIHVRKPLYDWRATNTSLAYTSATKPWAAEAARRALADAAGQHARGPVSVEPNPDGQGYQVNWRDPDRPITVVIPTHSNLEGLRVCIRGLLEETDYAALKLVIIANRCDDALMRAELESFAGRPGVKVIDDPSPFNWSALMNRAMAQVDTESVLFLNDDVEILAPDWLCRMHRYLDLPHTGAVGATLFYLDGSLQHGGIETDPYWVAGEVKRSVAPQEAAGVRDVSAVTGACLLTTRSAIAGVGGLDEALPNHYGDVDFCLALRQAGYRVVQAADVRLKHHESVTRGRVERTDDPVWNKAMNRMRRKWGDLLKERYRVTFQMAAVTRILSTQA
jgi:GT2 family glycosyltransferase